MDSLNEKISSLRRQCVACGHEWLKRVAAQEPKRCPNPACRSKNWQPAGDPNGVEADAQYCERFPSQSVRRFLKEETGQDLVEYALVVAAVALALISTVTALGNGIAGLYESITGRLTGVDWTGTR